MSPADAAREAARHRNGQFGEQPKTDPGDLALTEPASFPQSRLRPDADTWQWPSTVDRSRAITGYDDDAGWWTVGDRLTVHGPTLPEGWIDRHRNRIADLAEAGVHGDLQVHTDPHGDGTHWTGSVDLPEGKLLTIESYPSGTIRVRIGIAKTTVDVDEDDLPDALLWAARCDVFTDQLTGERWRHPRREGMTVGSRTDDRVNLEVPPWLGNAPGPTIVVGGQPGGDPEIATNPVDTGWAEPQLWSLAGARMRLPRLRAECGAEFRALVKDALARTDQGAAVQWLRAGGNQAT